MSDRTEAEIVSGIYLMDAKGDDFADLPEDIKEWLNDLGYMGRKMVREWCVAKLNEKIKKGVCMYVGGDTEK